MPTMTRRVQATMDNKGAFDIWERAVALEAAGTDMIHLEIGEPDTGTPDHIINAAEQALRQGRTRYDMTLGTQTLRAAISDYLVRSRGVEVSPERVVVTSGVKMALFCTLQAVLDIGDEILLPDPGYPMYHTLVPFAEANYKTYPLLPKLGFQPDFDQMRRIITPRTKAILLTSPGNPTGAIHPTEVLEEVAAIAAEHDLWIIADEIYAQIFFSEQFPPSILSIPGVQERTIVIDGWSKPYSMTGWRVGFGIFPEHMVPAIEGLLAHTTTCVPPFIMDAAETAIQADLAGLGDIRRMYKERRDIVLKMLDGVPGLVAHRPDGAFYLMIDLRGRVGHRVTGFADALLERGVAVLPGDGMGEQAKGFIRISLTQPAERIAEAMRRMVALLDECYPLRTVVVDHPDRVSLRI